MGRALFSTRYAPQVAVRTEPQVASPYEKWSIWNPFDPESDEFNRDAQREVFIDTEAYRQEQETVATLLVADPGTDSSGSSEASDSDRGSPMAVGPDDPAVLIADAYSSVDWEPYWAITSTGAPAEWGPRRGTAAESTGDQMRPRLTRPRSTTDPTAPPFLPPSSLRNSMTASEIDRDTSATTAAVPISTLASPSRHTGNIPPISIPNESPMTTSPASPPSPVTPTDILHAREMQSLLTPSPPPSVSPHVYTWRRISLGVPPSSPLANQTTTSPVGPLTNPSARRSLARINIAAPARVRIQNAAV